MAHLVNSTSRDPPGEVDQGETLNIHLVKCLNNNNDADDATTMRCPDCIDGAKDDGKTVAGATSSNLENDMELCRSEADDSRSSSAQLILNGFGGSIKDIKNL